MQFPTSLNWFRRLIVLGAVVAAATASTAAAGVMIDAGGPIDVQGSTPLGLKADGMRLQGIAEVYKSLTNDSVPTAQGLRADGLRLTGIAQVYQQLQPQAVPTAVTSPTSGTGLDWGDFGIGAGAMFGLAMLVTGLGIGALAMRHRTGKLGTS